MARKPKSAKRTKPVLKKATVAARPSKPAKGPSRKKPGTRASQPQRVSGKYDSIRQDLVRQRAALLAEAGAVLAGRRDQTVLPDLTDQAQVEVDRNFELRLKEREQKLLKKIDQAVERIDGGTFGICRGCGNEIPLPRLQARPVTDLCIACKTRQEHDENIRATG